MPLDIVPRNLPVLLFYNVDHCWTPREKEDVISVSSQLESAISLLGHPTISVQLYDDDIEHVLSRFDPLSYIVFNWCEGIPGVDHSEHLVAQTL